MLRKKFRLRNFRGFGHKVNTHNLPTIILVEGDPTFFPDHFPWCINKLFQFIKIIMFLRSLNCFAIVLLTWFGNSCVHYQPKYYYSAWYIHPFLEFNFSSGFFGLFCLFLCFLYDKINYIVLRNESEVITQGNLRPRPLMYWPSNSEVNTSRLRSAVILLQIQK